MRTEDPLIYLPAAREVIYQKGRPVFTTGDPCSLVLVNAGMVKSERGGVLMGIYGLHEFVGVESLGGRAVHEETAIALGRVSVMSWSFERLEAVAVQRPLLWLALAQMAVGRCAALSDRAACLSLHYIDERLAIALIGLAAKFGSGPSVGRLLPAFTHELLAQCTGTSREIVSRRMGNFRRSSLLTYTRGGITINVELLSQALDLGLLPSDERRGRQ